MNVLRQISTRRLLALCASVVVAAGGGTAIASALGGGGPVPPPAGLADAIHAALTAPSVQGVTARIAFTNHLVDTSSIPGGRGNPLLTGATGRLWLSPTTHQLRLELQSQRGDSQLVVSGGQAWFYDGSSNTVYRATLPVHHDGADAADAKGHRAAPTVSDIAARIADLQKHAIVDGPIPGDVGGQAAYTVRVSPRHDGGLLGAGEVAWDATHGIPLRVAVYAQGDSSPVLELKASSISFGPVSASDFAVSPPSGAKVVPVRQMGSSGRAQAARVRAARVRTALHARAAGDGRSRHPLARPAASVAAAQAALPFTLAAPEALAGLPRQDIRVVGSGRDAAALIIYGQGLGGIAVLERPAHGPAKADAAPRASAGGDGGDQGGSLPTVSIGGATGHELSTALGTLVTFERTGVSYVIVGSVPANAAEAAARGL